MPDPLHTCVNRKVGASGVSNSQRVQRGYVYLPIHPRCSTRCRDIPPPTWTCQHSNYWSGSKHCARVEVMVGQFEQLFNLLYYQIKPTLCEIRDLYRVDIEDPVFCDMALCSRVNRCQCFKVYIAFFPRITEIIEGGLLNPRRRRHNVPSKPGDLLTPLHIRTSKKTIFNNNFSVKNFFKSLFLLHPGQIWLLHLSEIDQPCNGLKHILYKI